jgi:hypothetical protein
MPPHLTIRMAWHDNKWNGEVCKDPVGNSYCGGRGASHCCAVLERYLPECGFDVVDMIALRRQNLEFKLPILELTGEWLITKPTSEKSVLPKQK